jgi:hypothetical protein
VGQPPLVGSSDAKDNLKGSTIWSLPIGGIPLVLFPAMVSNKHSIQHDEVLFVGWGHASKHSGRVATTLSVMWSLTQLAFTLRVVSMKRHQQSLLPGR